MSEIRDLLKEVTKPDSNYQKRAIVCRVRDYGSDIKEGELNADGKLKAGLLYHVEPIDSDSYIDKVYKNTDGSNGTMTPDEIEQSKDNWIFDVTVNADPKNALGSGAKFDLPSLNSFVVIEWLNDTDAYISLTSSVAEILIKLEENIIRITPDDFNVLVKKNDVELTVKDLISLRNKKNVIEVNVDDIKILAGNTENETINGTLPNLFLISNDRIVLTGNATNAIKGQMIIDDRFSIRNGNANFKLNILDVIITKMLELQTNIGLVNTAIPTGVSAPLPIIDFQPLSKSISKLFN